MAIVDFRTNGYSIQTIGKFGKPNGLGDFWCGWSELGEDEPLAGYYQRRRGQHKQINVRCRHYICTNPQTAPQQAWRGTFASGVAAWKALSEENKEIWRRKKTPYKMNGFMRFMRVYLLTH